MSSARSGDRAPRLLPGFASPSSSDGTDGASCKAANSRAAATLRVCLRREAPTSVRPWVGHRLRRLCSAEERKARGPRAQRASCSDSLRLSERSERSSRREFRNGATRLSTTGDRRLQGDGAASEAADGGPPAALPAHKQGSQRQAAMPPQAVHQFGAIERHRACAVRPRPAGLYFCHSADLFQIAGALSNAAKAGHPVSAQLATPGFPFSWLRSVTSHHSRCTSPTRWRCKAARA